MAHETPAIALRKIGVLCNIIQLHVFFNLCAIFYVNLQALNNEILAQDVGPITQLILHNIIQL